MTNESVQALIQTSYAILMVGARRAEAVFDDHRAYRRFVAMLHASLGGGPFTRLTFLADREAVEVTIAGVQWTFSLATPRWHDDEGGDA